MKSSIYNVCLLINSQRLKSSIESTLISLSIYIYIRVYMAEQPLWALDAFSVS
jgi:hypothetical protein